jgi:glycosyltransferase involved in cell wall biosynthesis
MVKRKLIRVMTADFSHIELLKGQGKFMSQYYDVLAIGSDTGRINEIYENEGIRAINIPMKRSLAPFSDLKCLLQFIKVFRKEKPFIVNAGTPKGSLLAMIAAKITCVPHRIYSVTGLRYEGCSGFMRWLLMTMERISCLCANKVIPEGNGVKNTLIRDHITNKPLEVVLNGNINGVDMQHYSVESVSQSKAEIRKQMNLTDDDFAFIFIGRLVKDKGINELASAMMKMKSIHPNVKLIVVGNYESKLGPLHEDTVNFINHDSSVRYIGYQYDVRPAFIAADALAFPSYREGFPNVVLQAGAMGLASIVTDISGCNEIVIEGVNGKIIPPRNSDRLFEEMKWFYENQDEVKEMSSRARQLIQDRYEQSAVWNALLNVYQKMESDENN